MSSTDKYAQLVSDYVDNKIDRRSFLRSAVVAGLSSAAAYELLLSAKSASAQAGGFGHGNITTFAIGEEDGSQPIYTTQALGEEGNPPAPQPVQPQPVPSQTGSTQAIGEEDFRPPSQATTEAIGEEEPAQITTLAIGEEDGTGGFQPITLACGEEGTDCATPPPPPPPPPPVTTTSRRWGEEGHGFRRWRFRRQHQQPYWNGWSDW